MTDVNMRPVAPSYTGLSPNVARELYKAPAGICRPHQRSGAAKGLKPNAIGVLGEPDVPESEPQPPAQITDRVIAQFNSYEGMLAAMRLRAKERQLALGSDNVAALTGLPAFYFSKLLSPKAPRRIGSISMAPVMAILGVKLVMVEDPETMARYASRLHKRHESFVHSATVHISLSGKHMRAIRRKQNSRKFMPARKARALARHAANIRWAKARGGEAKG